jgi:transposase
MKQVRYSPEVKDRAVRLALEAHGEAAGSMWSAIESVAAKIGCAPQTLNEWVKQAQRDAGEREGPTTAEKKRVAELEREVRELRKANEILKLASAFFAQAELDRRLK